ncbi:MAG: DR2241 family protein [Rubrobacter sp.]
MPEIHRKESVAAEARRAFTAWIEGAEFGQAFGEVRVTKTLASNGYTVHHRDDEPEATSEAYTDPRLAREVARLTEEGEYRPLKSSPNLRRGWRLDLRNDHELMTAMNYLYPAAVTHWHREREGRLEITSFRENAGRQSGIYERIKHLSDAAVQNAVSACCEDSVCLKRTLWDVDEGNPLGMDRGAGEIPCPEPCSVFVAFARKVRSFEKEEIYREDDPEGLTPSEKKDLLALVGAVAGGEPKLAREAEFDEPLNVRRMRYRRLTLSPKLEVSRGDA